MRKNLSELTLEELWELFPIILDGHNPEYKKWYLKEKENIEKVFHLHLRFLGDWDELYFRDFLKMHKEIAKKYGELKQKLRKQYEHNRDGYTEAKTAFIKKWTNQARKEFPKRYLP